jgi:hypothetical protein
MFVARAPERLGKMTQCLEKEAKTVVNLKKPKYLHQSLFGKSKKSISNHL